MPCISVVIPAYNQERYLSECLQSVLDQTFSDWEAIVVDDGSTDDTPHILDDFALQDARIVAMHIVHGGAATARNNGLDIASGTYILFVDADDYVEPSFFAEALQTLNESDADVAYFGHRVVGYGNRARTVAHPLGERILENVDIDKYIASLYGGDSFHTGRPFPIALWAAVFKRKVIEGASLRFLQQRQLEDCAFNIAFCGRARRIATSDRVGYCYRREGQSSLSRWGEDEMEQVLGNLGALCAMAQKEPSRRRAACVDGANRTVVRWTRLLVSRALGSQVTRPAKRALFDQVVGNRLIVEANSSCSPEQLPLWERVYRWMVLHRSFYGTAAIEWARHTLVRTLKHDY